MLVIRPLPTTFQSFPGLTEACVARPRINKATVEPASVCGSANHSNDSPVPPAIPTPPGAGTDPPKRKLGSGKEISVL